MVLLQKPSSRNKNPSSKSTNSTNPKPPNNNISSSFEDQMISILAEAGCTLKNPNNIPSLPLDLHKFRQSLHHLFSTNPSLLSQFLQGFTSFTQKSPNNFQTFLTTPNSSRGSSGNSSSGESLLRILLLIPSLQLQLQHVLLEKLPEYFDTQIAGQIINLFRFLDFLVDSKVFVDKLLEVVSICPLNLKKEIIGSLPEIIGGDEKNNDNVVESLQRLLQEDSEVIVPVFDSFSNLHLSEKLQEQVVTIGLSFIRTIDAQHMPFLLRFLLLSATSTNARRIISQIRYQLKFVGGMDSHSSRSKGKSVADNFEGLVLEALLSSLRFKNILCQEIINELKSIDRAEDHKVIDVWLLMLIYMNGGTMQKTVEKVVKKKIIDDCLGEAIFDQCIHGHRELVQEYFPSFLSVCEYLLVCKEKKAREFGIHLYVSLFKEFSDTYSRHEILGALVTHIGSGVVYEVGSALNAMVLLASKYLQELIPLSSYIIGILDYIEGFNDENLHKVYEVFSHLALSARSNADSVGSSIANELLIVVRKQVSNQDLKYKKMGLIGTLKIVSCLGHMNNATNLSSSQKTNCEESLELLRMSLDSCKSFPLPMIMFYDELIALLERTKLQPAIMDWIGKHVGDFESIFLSDLEGGQLLSGTSFCGLEGELWMNLDGDLSPICLNILPLLSSLQSSSPLQILPAYFLLLSVVERLTNQGSLGGIDALLGCPLYLPSPKYLVKTAWSSLTGKQKEAMCLSLYYAFNWIRELLNAFCTQVTGSVDCTSQTTIDEIIAKLLKRLRNLVFLESLLNTSLKLHPLPLPELHLFMEHSGSSYGKPNLLGHMEKKNEKRTISQSTSSDKKLKRKSSTISDNGKLKQPTILDVLRRAGALSQEVPSERSSDQLSKGSASQHEEKFPDSDDSEYIEISAADKILDGQIFKCRALSVDCLSLLAFSKAHDTCCSDSAAELPLHLYLLRDLCHKLDCLTPQTKQNLGGCIRAPFGNSKVIASEFVNKIRNLFPCMKKHFDCAVSILKEGEETCQEHWKIQSASAGNPDIHSSVVSKSSVAGSVFREVLSCMRKMLNLPDIKMNTPVLSDLLKAFQPMRVPDSAFTGIQPIPSPGNMDYLYCGVFLFMEGVMDTACSSSVLLASEVLVTLESIVDSANFFLEGISKSMHIGFAQRVIPSLRSRLGTSAHKLIMHNWDCDNLANGGKSKGETIQKTLQIHFQNSESTADLLEEFACSILPQAPVWKTKSTEEAVHGIPTLCATTFIVWYRALFEENHAILNKLVKEVTLQEKSRVNIQVESVKALLIKLHQSVKVVVSLVNVCKTHDKVAVHAMAVKYGGKFVDSFLKVFDFLQAHFQAHGEIIIQLVKELQKATRTIQTLCSEAKGSKRTMITSKIPATKRSMERFLFQVKALLHNTTNGCTFWMGNLKHKDLYGQVVSSQVYADVNTDDEVQNDIDEEEPHDHMDEDVEEQPVSICSQQDGEAEPCE
ncbi:hypothetical protein AQUCO_02600232v1 [Aquilegia coerulea]|uniref:Fanconi anemia group D2 protein n=1 Tax=Aquilegia coerulea TaxID=218851 RepID=A0A2G5D7Z5_AQUCA|nr:hypothetical protein AQUCO_02600232v1 [Aquilegia coerulea]